MVRTDRRPEADPPAPRFLGHLWNDRPDGRIIGPPRQAGLEPRRRLPQVRQRVRLLPHSPTQPSQRISEDLGASVEVRKVEPQRHLRRRKWKRRPRVNARSALPPRHGTPLRNLREQRARYRRLLTPRNQNLAERLRLANKSRQLPGGEQTRLTCAPGWKENLEITHQPPRPDWRQGDLSRHERLLRRAPTSPPAHHFPYIHES